MYQPSFDILFSPAVGTSLPAGPSILSAKQRETIRTNPFWYIFQDVPLDRLDAVHDSANKPFRKHDTLEDLQSSTELSYAYWAAQTLALDTIYREADERFLSDQTGTGTFSSGGKSYEVRWNYYTHFLKTVTDYNSVPHQQVELRGDEDSPISSTGFNSQIYMALPIGDGLNLESLIEGTINLVAHGKCANITVQVAEKDEEQR